LEGGINTYSYVENNPTINIDPEGLLFFGGSSILFFRPPPTIIRPIIEPPVAGPKPPVVGPKPNVRPPKPVPVPVPVPKEQCDNEKGMCKSKYPGYLLCSQIDYFRFSSRFAAASAIGQSAKVRNEQPLKYGICAVTDGAGYHWDVYSGGTKIGSIASCTCCQNTPSGPELETKFRIN